MHSSKTARRVQADDWFMARIAFLLCHSGMLGPHGGIWITIVERGQTLDDRNDSISISGGAVDSRDEVELAVIHM